MDLRTGIALVLIFALALLVRSYYNVEPAQKDGYQLTGGSDPYYHKRVSDYVINTGQHLIEDNMLNYPLGGTNNRPPVFDWSLAIEGLAFSPFNNNDVEDTAWKMYLFMPALWGALTVIPVFYIGRAQFGKGAGLWGALIFGLMSGHITHTTLALADHDAYFLFFTATAFYFFMRAVMVANEGKWVTDWTSRAAIKEGLTSYLKYNRQSLGYAGLAGMSVTAVALAWKGFPYLLVIIFVYTLFQLLVNMFQRKDSLAVGVVAAVAMGLPLLLSLPYYNAMNFVSLWWSAPFYIFLATLVAVVVLVPTRDLPWTMVLTATAIVALVSYGLLKYLFVEAGVQLFSGQGYFIRTKLSDTIAEAQPPRFSTFVFAYGMATTWLALVGAAYMVFLIWKQKQWKADYLFVLVWAVTAIYMARSAVRFIYNATPVFALLSGWIVWMIIKWADFPGWRTNLRRLSGGGYQVNLRYRFKDRAQGVWKATSWKHPTVAVLVVLLVVGANGVQALDAGVPFEAKKETDVWIWKHVPLEGILKPEEYNTSERNNATLYPEGVGNKYNLTNNELWYLGVSGPSFPSDYWVEGLRWLAEQDTELAPEKRPGFISWWDYGFWAIDIGEHPTVADNFQWGYQVAGNFIAAQSEQEALALLLFRLLQAERVAGKEDPDRPFKEEIRPLLVKHLGKQRVDDIDYIFANPGEYKEEDVNQQNTIIRQVRPILMELETEELADLLYEVEQYTNNSIRYFAVDQRLMPFSASNTGILYAPVTLADYDITDFIEIVLITSTGEELTNEEALERAREDPNFQIVDQRLAYKERFFNSMFYRAFIGWSGPDIGGELDDGVPGLAGDLANTDLQRMPGRNMTHFKLVKTLPGLTVLKHYDGAKLYGQVRTPQGQPVPNARVTLLDITPEAGAIPHTATFTDQWGYYELTAVAGNLSLLVSMGPMPTEREKLLMVSNNILAQEEGILVSEAQAYRQGRWEILHDIEVEAVTLDGRLYWDLNGDDTYSQSQDEVLEGVAVVLTNNFTGRTTQALTDEQGNYLLEGLAPGEYRLEAEVEGHTLELASYLGEAALRAGQALTEEGRFKPGRVEGNLEFSQTNRQNVTLSLTDLTTGQVRETSATHSYTFDQLLPGNYTLKVIEDKLASDLTANRVNLELAEGQTRAFNLTLQPGLTLRGTTWLGSELLANQTVEYTSLDGEVQSQVQADAQGAFELVLPQGRYTLYALHRDQELAYVFSQRLDTATFSGPLTVNLRQAGKLSGTVFYDDNGNRVFDPQQERSVGNLEIAFHSETGISRASVTSGGSFAVYLAPGKYTAYVSTVRTGETGGQPYAGLISTQVIVGQRDLNVGLRPAHELTGVLVEGEADAIEGALALSSARGTLHLSTLQGREFAISLPTDTYTFELEKFGYELVEPVEVTLTGNRNLEVAVKPLEVTLTGKVTWRGHPLTGATVSLADFNDPETPLYQTSSQAGGYYALEPLPGHYLVTVEKDLGASRYAALTDVELDVGAASLVLDLTTELRVRVRGSSTSQGAPVGGNLIFTPVDSPEGAVEVVNRPLEGYEVYLPRDSYYVTFSDPTPSLHLSLLETLEVADPLDHDFQLSELVWWDGALLNRVDNSEISKAVEVSLSAPTGSLKFRTSLTGRIEVDLPPGEYQVQVNLGGYQPYQANLTVAAHTMENLLLEPLPVSLSGRLTYETPQGEKVGLNDTPFKLQLSGQTQLNYTGMTNATGHYQLAEVLPGGYRFIVDYTRPEGVRFTLNESKFMLAGKVEQTFNRNLNAKYHLHGRVYYDRNFNGRVDSGEVLADSRVELWTPGGTSRLETLEVDEQGGYTVYRLHGDLLLKAAGTTPGGATMVASRLVSMSQAVEADLLLARGVALEATLVYGGQPVEVADVTLTGPLNLSLTPQAGVVSAALPLGDYNLKVEHEENGGLPDYLFTLDENLTLGLTLEPAALELELERHVAHSLEVVSLSPLIADTKVGEQVNFSFNVSNNGFFTDTYRLEVTPGPENWTVELDPGAEFEVAPGETMTANVYISPDRTVVAGIFADYEVSITWSNEREDDIDDLSETFELRVTPHQWPKPNFKVELTVARNLMVGEIVDLQATVSNVVEGSGTHEVKVRFTVDDRLIGEEQTVTVEYGQSTTVVEPWKVESIESTSIKVEVDPDNAVAETYETDNLDSSNVVVENEPDKGLLENPWLVGGLVVAIVVVVVVIGGMYNSIRSRSSARARSDKRR